MRQSSNSPNIFYNQDQLKSLIRLLATQNSMWTRNYIVSYLANLDDITVLENRILLNVIDIKNVFNVYYSNESSSNLESLLRVYVSDLLDTLRLLKVNYNSSTNTYPQVLLDAQEKWNMTGTELAEFLSEINPNWDYNLLQTLILDHIKMTSDQMIQRLRGDYAFEVHQYDFIEYHVLLIADYISKGIIDMFYY